MRAASEADGPAIATLAELAGGSGWWGVEQRTGPDRPEQARFVETDGEAIVAYGCVWPRSGTIFGLDTLVHPRARGHGVGRKLIDRLFEELAARGATAVEARIDAAHTDALGFLVRRGFIEVDRVEHLRLDVERAVPDESTPAGVDIVTLGEGRDEGSIRALATAAFHERPVGQRAPFAGAPVDELVAELDHAFADGSFVARVAGATVGLTGLLPGTEAGTLIASLTIVHPDQRRRGIASALKHRTIAWARRGGYRAIFSHSPSRAMQSLNESLGFERIAPTEIRMGRRLVARG